MYCVLTAIDEKARVVELNSKLHELCRELRKENALLLDTSKAISAQELSQRKALTENFQETVEGITRRSVTTHAQQKLVLFQIYDLLKSAYHICLKPVIQRYHRLSYDCLVLSACNQDYCTSSWSQAEHL